MIKAARGLKIGFVIAIAMLVVNMLVPMLNARWAASAWVEHDAQEQQVRELQLMLSALKDGETGQRGFVITGREDFLAPLYQGYETVDRLYAALETELAGTPDLLELLVKLRPVIEEQRVYFTASVESRRTEGLIATSERISSGRGKMLMDDIRGRVETLQQGMNARLLMLEQEIAQRERISRVILLIVALLNLLVIALLFHFTFSVLREGRASRRKLEHLSEELAGGKQQVELRNHEISLLSRMGGRCIRSTTSTSAS